MDVIATRTSDDSAVGHLVPASRSSSKARETRSMLVEFTDDWRADAKSKLNDFISQNVLSEDAWDMTICDKNGQRLPGPPNAGVIEPFPISFVFTRKDVETVNQSAEDQPIAILAILQGSNIYSIGGKYNSPLCSPDTVYIIPNI